MAPLPAGALTMAIDKPIWGYGPDDGPEMWGSLDPTFWLCDAGTEQSPIDLAGAQQGERGDLTIAYDLGALTAVDQWTTLNLVPEAGGSISYEGTRYALEGLHFHAPSEHTFAGRHADLEAHFVHRAADGALAVIGVMFSEAENRQPIDDLLTAIPGEQGGSLALAGLHDIQRLIPPASRRYQYSGSLTTPPGSEGVSWIVMEEGGPVGAAALQAFSTRYGPNNRPVQPINHRQVVLG